MNMSMREYEEDQVGNKFCMNVPSDGSRETANLTSQSCFILE